MISISANPSTDSGALENLLFKATNPSNKCEDVNTIKQFCDLINKDETECSSVIAIRLLAHKIQSPQEMEAIQALAVLEACVKSCGSTFRAEVGKFKFLNEMIKLVSPRYLGSRTPEHVKKKVIELLYLWSTSVKEETKILEAYQMLKNQGIVTSDPVHVKDAVFAPSLPPRLHEDPLSEDQSKQLKKLLQSRNPEDLQRANKIIRGMVQEDEKRIEALSKRNSELTLVGNNAKLLNEMLDHYDPDSVPTDELELLKELALSCEKMQPKIYRLASESEDDGLGEILSASDDISRVLERYKTLVTEGKKASDRKSETSLPQRSPELLDMNAVSDMNLMDEDILKLLSNTPPPKESSPPSDSSKPVIDLLTNGSPIKLGAAPLSSASLLPCPSANGGEKETPSSRVKGLLELDALGEEAMKALLPTVTPEFTKKYEKKLSMNDLQKKKVALSLQASSGSPQEQSSSTPLEAHPEQSPPIEQSPSQSIPKLSEIKVSLSDISPRDLPPINLSSTEDGIGISLHVGKEELYPGIIPTVLTYTNRHTSQVDQIELRPLVPKDVKVRLLAPSGKSLPPFNPFIPPPAATQIMLIQRTQKLSSFKYVLSYQTDNEPQTEIGSVMNELPF